MNVLTQGVKVTVDFSPSSYPGPAVIDCVLSLGDLKSTRASEKYSCMSSNVEFVAVGSISREPMTLSTLYNEDQTDGQYILKTAFKDNDKILVRIEFDNAQATNPTTIIGRAYVTQYTETFEKNKLIESSFELSWTGKVLLVEARSNSFKASDTDTNAITFTWGVQAP
jgi:hypothetical protein